MVNMVTCSLLPFAVNEKLNLSNILKILVMKAIFVFNFALAGSLVLRCSCKALSMFLPTVLPWIKFLSFTSKFV